MALVVSRASLSKAGNYDVMWDAVGGKSLATALTMLSAQGVCVNYGNSLCQPATFDIRAGEWPFYGIRCIWLGREPVYTDTPILESLVEMVKQDKLRTPIDRVSSWADVNHAAQMLLQQQINGKAVLELR